MGLWEILKGEEPGFITKYLNYENKGQFGEFTIEYALTNDNIEGNMAVLKNIYVPIDGKTSEIDLVMIHEKGIFVFESKNYSGWIFGSTDQLYWTQSLKYGVKNKFYNPIRQNRNHIKALAKFLDKPESEFVSYIVFSERCSLKKVPDNTKEVVIIQRPDMLKELRRVLSLSSLQYTPGQIRKMADKLKPLTNKDESDKQQHIDTARNKCPFCGQDLVLRTGKYGQFWGCSTYPKCRFTRPDK